MIEDSKENPSGAVVAWVDPEDTTCGTILFSHGCFKEEVEMVGTELNDFDCPRSLHGGLRVFEGVLQHSPGPDPDVYWVGNWRSLTHKELILVSDGVNILLEG